MKRLAMLLLTCLCILSAISGITFAAERKGENTGAISTPVQEKTPAIAASRPDVALRPVMAVILVSWIGISLYLFRIDRRLTKLEKELHE